MNKTKIIFLGSPAFAVPALQLLIDSGHYKPVAVITQPDRPAGRKMQLTPTPVKELAVQSGIPVWQPPDVNAPEFVHHIQSLQPDLLITVAYGEKLKKALRESAVHGAVNLHPSLLPVLRGAAPVPFALWQGMSETGITIFRLISRMDAGPVYHQKHFYIFPSENATTLLEHLALQGAREMLVFLDKYFAAPFEPVPQDETGATYCRKIDKDDCRIDWTQSATEIHNQIRALALLPGAYTNFRDTALKIMCSVVLETGTDKPSGTITALKKNTGFCVQTGKDCLAVTSVQPAGKKTMSAWAFHLGSRITIGERLK
jgi:methionyl-tRNA formyltransferase